jgi:DNA-binding SARP family transcriptional activator
VEALRIRLLGGLDVEGLEQKEIGSRKARTLVKLLALGRGAPVAADLVADALWGDDPPSRPADQVGVLVSRLRSVLGADRLTRSDAGWALAVDWLDVAELEARTDEAAARLAAHSPGAARAAAQAALALVRGELVADEPDPRWAEADRAALDRTVARARLIAAEAALAVGEPGEAAAAAEGALDHDPYDEAALRVLMRAHAAAGRPASALGAYARTRARLADDLGVDPVAETEELHTAILLGAPAAEPAGAALGSAGNPRIVGRSAELAGLDRLLERAAHGEPVLAVVEGEAGIGKSALVTAWAAELGSDAVVLLGRCDELGRELALQPVLDGLARHLRSLSAEEAEAALGDTVSIVGPLLGRFVSEHGERPTVVSDPAAGQALLFASLLTAVERCTGPATAVVVVEDVHLAGDSTLEWLRFAVRRGRRLLVLATMRPGGHPIDRTATIALGPLDLAAVTELVGPDRAADLHARSGGHPLFLTELAAAAGAASDALPSNVRESVDTRVDQLGPAATTLRTAAILGAEVDVDLLAGVLGAPVAELLEHLDAGVRALVVEERSTALTFRHELVREALVAGTTAARRAFVHREAARVLRGRLGHDAIDVAWHARLGGDADTAVAALVDAAATASSRFDMVSAEELLGSAIELVDTVTARVARARVRIARFEMAGAEEDAIRAVALGGGPEALEVAGWAAYYRRDYELARRRADEAVQRSDDPGLRASCLALSGRVLHASGRLEEAEPRMIEAAESAPPSMRGVAQIFLAGLRVHQGDVDEGGELVERALVDPTQLGHPFARGHGHLFLALSAGMRGRPVEAWRAADQGAALAASAGESGARFLAVTENIRSWMLRSLGRLEEADECNQRALEIGSRAPGTTEMVFAAGLDLADGRLLAGDADGASSRLDDLTHLLTGQGSMTWHHRQRYGVLRARIALLTGDHDLARELAASVVADADARGTPRYGAFARLVCGEAAAAAGESVDHADIDAALLQLDRCAGLEAWRVTAELAARTGVERWWRDADRRAGALVANAGEHGEPLRRWIGTTFVALGRA